MKPRIEDLKCLDRVAKVCGLTRAKCELFKVVNSGVDIVNNDTTHTSFVWIDTPQGHDFWNNIHTYNRGK